MCVPLLLLIGWLNNPERQQVISPWNHYFFLHFISFGSLNLVKFDCINYYIVEFLVVESFSPIKQRLPFEVHLNSEVLHHKERHLQSANVLVSSLDAVQCHVFR